MPHRLLSTFVISFLIVALLSISGQGQDQEVLKIDTALVTFPVIVSDRNNVYIPDLQKTDFQVFEDGVAQELSFFAAIKEPFHVVLMIDTSGSTKEKLSQIQTASSVFVDQLQAADRVKIISFDDEVHEWGDFTNNRKELKNVIQDMQPGKGTRLYDAVRLALQNLAYIKGRKAIVIFTDGVDYRSFDARYDTTMKTLEESGVIVYPIRYDTRADTEAMVRQQQTSGGAIVWSEIIKAPPIGATPPTVPGETRVPSIGRGPVIQPPPMRRDRYPDDRYPDNRSPDGRLPDGNSGPIRSDRFPDASVPGNGGTRRGRDDSTGMMLDNLYKTADSYLNDLALKSGGKLERADDLDSLPTAFANIAAQLRNQYSLGYYPSNQMRAGKYRKVQVKVSRKDVVVRARPGYREPRN